MEKFAGLWGVIPLLCSKKSWPTSLQDSVILQLKSLYKKEQNNREADKEK